MTKETYLKSVDVLLDAYNSGTLFHGNCNHCAVGNLLGDSLWAAKFLTQDLGTTPTTGYIEEDWNELIGHTLPYSFLNCTKEEQKFISNHLQKIYDKAGLTEGELRKIEFAFESSIAHNYEYLQNEEPKQGQYLGLCAVLKVMTEMVEGPVNSELSQSKLDVIAQKFNVCI